MTIDLSSVPAGLLPMSIFCIGVYFITLCLRSVIEVKWPGVTKWKGWKKVLRVTPVILGGVAALIMKKYPYLDTLPSAGTRFIFGCFGGGLASFAYLVFKAFVQKWFGVKVEKGLGDSESPPPPQGE